MNESCPRLSIVEKVCRHPEDGVHPHPRIRDKAKARKMVKALLCNFRFIDAEFVAQCLVYFRYSANTS